MFSKSDELMGLEKTLNLPNILKSINTAKKKVKSQYSKKLNILIRMVACQTHLTALYIQQCEIKKQMDAVYDAILSMNVLRSSRFFQARCIT